jgi:hypothetical protein
MGLATNGVYTAARRQEIVGAMTYIMTQNIPLLGQVRVLQSHRLTLAFDLIVDDERRHMLPREFRNLRPVNRMTQQQRAAFVTRITQDTWHRVDPIMTQHECEMYIESTLLPFAKTLLEGDGGGI